MRSRNGRRRGGRRSHGDPGTLQGLDAFRKRGKRQVAFGAHHARAADLERQARVGGGFQLGHDVAEHLQHARQAIGAEQGQLIGKLTALRRADVKRHIGARQAHYVQVAHVLGKLARELRQVGARFDELRHPIEACCGIALAQRLHDVGQIAGIHAAEHALGNGQRDLALAERDGLLEGGERVAHAAAGVMGDQVEGVAFELHALGHAHRAQARDDGLVGYAAEIEALATRMDGLRHLLRVGGCQDEHHVIGRFLQRLEQRVERRDGQHVDLVDDIDLITAARGRELHAVDDLLAHVLHARTACRVELVNVGVHALGDHLAILAGAVRVGRGTLFAQKRLGK